MENTSTITIIGIDEKRPPMIRREPYIDLHFQLSQQAPEKWCDVFNSFSKKMVPTAKIDPKKGLFIDAYVREMDQIPGYLEDIKKQVIASNEQHAENLRLKELAERKNNTATQGDSSEQGKLDSIIAGLYFDA